MDLNRLNPWNWFQHEQPQSPLQMPFRREAYRPGGYNDPLDLLHREFDRLLTSCLERWHSPASELFSQPWREEQPDQQPPLRPCLDIEARDDSYLITIDLPGVDSKNVTAELSGNLLQITGRKPQQNQASPTHFYLIERPRGSFKRTLTLPEDVDTDGIEARVSNGMMTLVIPRHGLKETPLRQISIED